MNSSALTALYSKHLQALKLQGKREKKLDGYARALRRIAVYLDCCPDSLNPEQLKSYFAWMVESYS
jgi:integrase/recombinase XerD